MADHYGDGILRTESGRETYAPDGMEDIHYRLTSISNEPRARHVPIVTDYYGDGQAYQENIDNLSPRASSDARVRPERFSNLSGRTAARSRTSSFGKYSESSLGTKDLDDSYYFHTRRSGANSREFAPAGFTSGANEENFSREADVEKQLIKNQRQDEKKKEDKDPNLVEWNGPDDPGNPQNFPVKKKWIITCTLGIMTFCVTFASSVFSTATVPTAILFGVSEEVMVLGTSLFVLGFAFGPIVWGPFSELYGRKIPLFTGFFIFAIFQVPVAVAQNIYTVMICRFFGGFFASAPLAIVGGSFVDFFGPIDRGIAVTIFSAATFIGPVAGPIVGGFVTQSYLGWRWTAWITCFMAFAFGTAGFLIVPETFAPVLLQRRAKKIRYQTRNWAIHAKADEKEVNLKEIGHKYLLKPFVMLSLEPILVLVTLYMALIYGILYLFFEVYPISFQEERGWNDGVGALPFLSITVGVLMGGALIIFVTKTRFARKLKENGQVVPEERLIPMMIGGAVLPVGLFWFAWTSSPNITPWPQIIAGAPIGMGIMMIFLQGLNYIIDVYKMHSASAIAGNTFFRSWVGAGFPMFATGMYHNLGVPWATSLLGFLCVVLFPVPILFFIYGSRIRKLSKFAPS